MDKRSREKLALALLAALMLVAVCAMGWYIFVGHSWNKAASHIDDAVGKMDGYTVILYEGIVPEFEFDQGEVRENIETLKTELRNKSKRQNAKSGESESKEAEPKDKQDGFVPFTNVGGEAESANSPTAADASAESAEPASENDAASNGSEQSENAGSAGSASPHVPEGPLEAAYQTSSASANLLCNADYLEAIAKDYLDKDASVIRLYIGEPGYYADPFIVPKNGKRVGIFEIPEESKLSAAKATVKKLRDYKVDYIIAVCYDEESVDMSKLDVNLAIYALDANFDENGEWRDSTYCIDSPREGDLRTIIMSPSGVMTSKVIEMH